MSAIDDVEKLFTSHTESISSKRLGCVTQHCKTIETNLYLPSLSVAKMLREMSVEHLRGLALDEKLHANPAQPRRLLDQLAPGRL